MTATRIPLLLLACAALSACAADADKPERPSNQPDRPRPTIFISPAGQPFHAGPAQPYPVAQWFAQVDLDHDGRITREEFRKDFEAFFRTLDANHDGVIDSFELDDYEQKIAPEILSVLERPGVGAPSASPSTPAGDGPIELPGAGRRGRGGGDGPSRNSTTRLSVLGAAAYSLFPEPEPVASADANFDGKITLAEFLAAADRRFDQLDAKKLGYLTLDSLPRTPDQIAVEGKTPKAPAPRP
jgi:hypothetical protein